MLSKWRKKYFFFSFFKYCASCMHTQHFHSNRGIRSPNCRMGHFHHYFLFFLFFRLNRVKRNERDFCLIWRKKHEHTWEKEKTELSRKIKPFQLNDHKFECISMVDRPKRWMKIMRLDSFFPSLYLSLCLTIFFDATHIYSV